MEAFISCKISLLLYVVVGSDLLDIFAPILLSPP